MLEMIGEDSVDSPPYFARSDRNLTFFVPLQVDMVASPE